MSRDDYKLTITQAIEEMKQKQGDSFSYSKMNLAELSRMTGISRAKLRRLKVNIPDHFEPPVRKTRASVPEQESHLFEVYSTVLLT